MRFNKSNVLELVDKKIKYFEEESDKFIDDGAMLEELKCKQMLYQLNDIKNKVNELRC